MLEAIGLLGPMLSSGLNSPEKSRSNKVTLSKDNTWLRNKKKKKKKKGPQQTLGFVGVFHSLFPLSSMPLF